MNNLNRYIIDKFLQGKASREEISQIADYIYSEQAQKDLQKIQHEEFNSDAHKITAFDQDESFQSILKKINHRPVQQSGNNNSKYRYWYKLVAGIVLLVVASFLAYQYSVIETPETVSEINLPKIVKATEKGQRLYFKLPDGSMVTLNSGSRIEYLADFADGLRSVALSGEAFFEIKHDSLNQFTVNTDRLMIRVLGTSFNVKNDHKGASIALVDGTVALQHSKGDSLYMKPGEVIISTAAGMKKAEQDIRTVIGWKNGWLIFDNENLHKIVEKLENWYGVKFQVNGKNHQDFHYTGKFKNKSLKEVLEGISFVMMFDFEIKGNKVTIKR